VKNRGQGSREQKKGSVPIGGYLTATRPLLLNSDRWLLAFDGSVRKRHSEKRVEEIG
jgi:hypothetical protein